MAQENLKATARDRVGKGAARELRREGLVPAVIYGDKKPPLAIAIPTKEATLAVRAGGFLSRVIEVDVEGKPHKVLPRDYQLDPIRDFLLHVDFLRIGAGSRVTIDVPVRFENQESSTGLKRGGVLNIVRHTIEVTCLADAIPDGLVLDLSGADIGDSLHISAIDLPEGVEPTITDRDFTVCTIAAPSALRSEEEEAADAEEGEEFDTEAEDEEDEE